MEPSELLIAGLFFFRPFLTLTGDVVVAPEVPAAHKPFAFRAGFFFAGGLLLGDVAAPPAAALTTPLMPLPCFLLPDPPPAPEFLFRRTNSMSSLALSHPVFSGCVMTQVRTVGSSESAWDGI